MSDAFVILDSDEEEEQTKITSETDSHDDAPLFEDTAPIKRQQKRAERAKTTEDDDFDSFLNSIKTKHLTDISDNESIESPKDDQNKGKYAQYLQDLSSEEEEKPEKRKRTLKKPILSKQKQDKDSIDSFIDDSEDIIQQETRKDSIDHLLEQSKQPTKRRSLKNPTPNKKKNDTTNNDDIPSSSSRKDSLDDLLSMSSRKDSVDDILASKPRKKRSLRDHKRKNGNISSYDLFEGDALSEKQSKVTKKQHPISSDEEEDDASKRNISEEGDFMGREKKLYVTQEKQIASRVPRKKKQNEPEQIDLLSDDSDQDVDIKHKEKRPLQQQQQQQQQEKPRKFKPSSRLKVDKNNKPLRKDSIDMLLSDDDAESRKERPRRDSLDMLLDGDMDSMLNVKEKPRKDSIDMLLDDDLDKDSIDDILNDDKSMPARQNQKLPLKRFVYGSDSSPENSPTLKPKKDTKKRQKSKADESDDEDKEESISLKNKSPLMMDDELSDKANTAIHLDDSDGNNSMTFDDEVGLDTDGFFDYLINTPKKRKPDATSSSHTQKKRHKPHPLESVASSSKPILPHVDLYEDDEPIMTDRKGKKKAVEYQRRRNSIEDDLLNHSQGFDDDLTPKERRHLQSVKKKEEAQRKREEKKILKEQQKIEKERQLLYEKANKIKNNRNDVLKEIIIDIHPAFLLTKPGQIIQNVMEYKEVQVSPLDDDTLHSVSWRRKCTAEWDSDSQTFIPLSKTKLIDERFVLVYFEVNKFVQHIIDKSLDSFFESVKSKSPGKQLILLLEGLEVYYRKRKLADSRQFEKAVRESINQQQEEDERTSNSQRQRKSNKKTALHQIGPKKDEVEEVLTELQMLHDVMLLPTKDDEDTASWLESLTTDIALGRYKTKNLNNTYRVSKTGKGANDTFSKMLQEIQLCTPAIARSVMSAYPTAQSLYQAYQTSTRDGSHLLTNLQVEQSAVHARDRTINKVMSKKIHSIFTCTDPEFVIF